MDPITRRDLLKKAAAAGGAMFLAASTRRAPSEAGGNSSSSSEQLGTDDSAGGKSQIPRPYESGPGRRRIRIPSFLPRRTTATSTLSSIPSASRTRKSPRPAGRARSRSRTWKWPRTSRASTCAWQPNGCRELHWHESAEWAYMIAGKARVTCIDYDGKAFVDDVGPGRHVVFPERHPPLHPGPGRQGRLRIPARVRRRQAFPSTRRS